MPLLVASGLGQHCLHRPVFPNTYGQYGKFLAGQEVLLHLDITKSRLYNFDPLKPHFYIVKLGFAGVCIIFSYFAEKT